MDTSRPDILTSSGIYFDFLNPKIEAVRTDDIAHALSHVCRFSGHTRSFYSVAQHCVMVADLVPNEDKLAGLMHDAPEAYLGDVTRPLKRLLPDYRRIEKTVEAVVLLKYGIEHIPDTVKRADLVMLATEQRDLMPTHDDQWACIAGIEPLQYHINPLTPKEAKALFIERFCQIISGRGWSHGA